MYVLDVSASSDTGLLASAILIDLLRSSRVVSASDIAVHDGLLEKVMMHRGILRRSRALQIKTLSG